MNYSIEYHKHNKYLAVIYSSSYINPFDSIKEINNDMKRNSSKEGFVLFDLLLSNGNNFNRFFDIIFQYCNILQMYSLDHSTQHPYYR